MHDTSEVGTAIPAFLAKLWKLVNDPETDDIICWGKHGRSFIIVSPPRFTQELLPLYYKHNNVSSFIRQLNLYGFRKVFSFETGGLKSGKDYLEFSHTFFVKDHIYLLENIKRKLPATRIPAQLPSSVESVGVGNEGAPNDVLSQLLVDVNSMKNKQASWDAKLTAMKRENETLWRELAIFRQKHHKQEQIINKLIHFIVTMVQPNRRNVSLRRRYPLMLNDVQRSGTRSNDIPSSSSGPTIRELDPTEFLIEPNSPSNASPISGQYTIPDFTEDFQTKDESAALLAPSPSDSHRYVVLSPETATAATSPWLNLDMSDSEGEAMTPINPIDVNPALAEASVQIKPRLDVATLGQINKGGTLSSSSKGKRPRKLVYPKKSLSSSSKTYALDYEQVMDNSEQQDTNKESAVQKALGQMVSTAVADDEEESAAVPTVDETSIYNIGDPVPEGESNLAIIQKPVYVSDHVARDLGNHVDSIQGDLDFLKDFLKGENCSIDANTLLELFNDDPISLNFPPSSDNDLPKDANDQLMTYSSPSLLDLADLYGTPSGLATPQPSQPPQSPGPLDTPVHTPISPHFPVPVKRKRK